MRQPHNHRASISAALIFIAMFSGCDSLLYNSVDPALIKSNVALTESGDSERYEWPLLKNDYQVAKPAPLSYVTSFTDKFSVDDDFDAPLVPWDDLNLSPQAEAFMAEAYEPLPSEMERIVNISTDDFNGDQAFDLSRDGARLVMLSGRELVLYNVESGDRIGAMPLEKVWTNDEDPTIVRFCGRTKDFLIASNHRLVRVSGKDGKQVAEKKLSGDQIKRLDINGADTKLVVVTNEGRWYFGDSNLDEFTPIDLGDDLIENAALSHDGKRIVIVGGENPRLYIQKENGQYRPIRAPGYVFEAETFPIGGFSNDAWLDKHRFTFAYYPTGDDGKPEIKVEGIQMLWRPHLACRCGRSWYGQWYLTVGERVVDDYRQWVLFDFDPSWRHFSEPIVLDELPRRIVAGKYAENVGLLDSNGLTLYRRQAYRTRGRELLSTRVEQLIFETPTTGIKSLYDAIGRQKRWTAGIPPSELQSRLLAGISRAWRILDRKGDDRDEEKETAFERLNQWLDEGSVLATTVRADLHYSRAWKARGTGFSNTVTQKGWEIYNKEIAEFNRHLNSIKDEENLPARAYEYLIIKEISESRDISEANELIREAVKAYPENLEIAQEVGQKLSPQWGGEPGDVASFILAHSKLYEGKFQDIAYTRLLGNVGSWVSVREAIDWDMYDIERAKRGVKLRREAGFPDTNELWYVKALFDFVGKDRDKYWLLRSFMTHQACLPEANQYTVWYTPDTSKVPRQVFNETRHKSNHD